MKEQGPMHFILYDIMYGERIGMKTLEGPYNEKTAQILAKECNGQVLDMNPQQDRFAIQGKTWGYSKVE